MTTALATAGLLATAFFPGAAQAMQEVFVDSDAGSGGGLAFVHGSDCYVLTAAHVVERGKVTVTGPAKISAGATLVQEYEVDLALLKLSENRAEICGESMKALDLGIDEALKGSPQGELRRRGEAGGVESIPIRFETWDTWRVVARAVREDGAALLGWSGSILRKDGCHIAIVRKVKDRTVFALRLDRAWQLVAGELPQLKGPDPAFSILESVQSKPPGIYLIRNEKSGTRLRPSLFIIIEGNEDDDSYARPMVYERDVRGSCLRQDLTGGSRLSWFDITNCRR